MKFRYECLAYNNETEKPEVLALVSNTKMPFGPLKKSLMTKHQLREHDVKSLLNRYTASKSNYLTTNTIDAFLEKIPKKNRDFALFPTVYEIEKFRSELDLGTKLSLSTRRKLERLSKKKKIAILHCVGKHYYVSCITKKADDFYSVVSFDGLNLEYNNHKKGVEAEQLTVMGPALALVRCIQDYRNNVIDNQAIEHQVLRVPTQFDRRNNCVNYTDCGVVACHYIKQFFESELDIRDSKYCDYGSYRYGIAQHILGEPKPKKVKAKQPKAEASSESTDKSEVVSQSNVLSRMANFGLYFVFRFAHFSNLIAEEPEDNFQVKAGNTAPRNRMN